MPGFSLESATYLIRKPGRFSHWNVHADVLHAEYMRQQTRRCKQRQIFASHRMKDLWVGIGSFNRCHGHACAFGNDYRMTDVELRQVACESTAVINVCLFPFGRWEPSQHSCFC